MLPVSELSMSRDEKKLRKLYRGLNAADQQTLFRFAEFLAQSSPQQAAPDVFPEPVFIERVPGESVVKGIKRLTATYPMINKEKLLHQSSDLMASHIINGRPASDVIDDLEVMFAEHYQQMKSEFEQNR